MELIAYNNSENVLKEKGVRDNKLYCGPCYELSGHTIELIIENEEDTFIVNCNPDTAESNKIKSLELKCPACSYKEILEIVEIT